MLATKNKRPGDGSETAPADRRKPAGLSRFPQISKGILTGLALALALTACTPPGPRALLQGQHLLNEGRNAEAVEQLREAVSLLNTNAIAWNHLGLAYHRSGDVTNAILAYQQALKFNRDLSETHFNLGCLWLEQNRGENARAEFSAFTLRRPNVAAGWLRLGSIQLRARELAAAEKSYREALRCSPQHPEALNGLGLVQMQRGNTHDAVPFFDAALRQQPDYAPALLNLAIVSQYSLNDRAAALQKYREYLSLPARPANWEAVNAAAAALEQDIKGITRPAPVVNAAVASNPPARTNLVTRTAAAKPEAAATTRPTNSAETARMAPPADSRTTRETSSTAGTVMAESSPDDSSKPAKPGFFQKLFHRNSTTNAAKSSTLPPAPALTVDDSPRVTSEPAAAPAAPPVLNVPRYKYHSITKPSPGNRLAAEKSFLQGLQSQRNGDLAAAIQSYNRATAQDPAYFEAFYNLGLAAGAAGDIPQALGASEHALAIRPDSVDARLNFAQLLKQVNFYFDAANELATVVAKSPGEARAHLALGNLYAQQFHQPAKAREHYLKVLELEPRNPQSAAIREWLVSNPR
ncbi:MAG: tetratricopeptide repeat protein [Verrucomicrobiota bacterium]